jgi:hypothetical protein
MLKYSEQYYEEIYSMTAEELADFHPIFKEAVRKRGIETISKQFGVPISTIKKWIAGTINPALSVQEFILRELADIT